MSDTPRTDKASDFTAPEKLYRCSQQLERELTASTAELAATKEQLRVAREAILEALLLMNENSDYEAYKHLLAFTQPNLSADSLGGGNPAKGEGGVPSTFPA